MVGKNIRKSTPKNILRKLTEEEIENILDFIEPEKRIPEDIAWTIYEVITEDFREQLQEIKIHPKAIPELKEELTHQYFSSRIQPGECVGVICAQSCGEKQTQMTLNSVDWQEKILYVRDGNVTVEHIGKTIDEILTKNIDKITHIEKNRTEYLELDSEWKIPSCDENGKTGWYRIEAVTRHLPVGDLVKVTTSSGRTVTATQAKSFLVWNGEKFVDKNGSDIKVGDILPRTYALKPLDQLEEIDGVKLTEGIGFLIGVYLTTTMELDPVEKLSKFIMKHCDEDDWRKVPEFAYQANLEFIRGFANGAMGKTQTFFPNILYGVEFIKTCYHFSSVLERERDVYFDPIVSIEYVKGTTEYVYDLTVEKTRNFQLFNGLNCRDTFHKAGASEKGMTSGVPRFKEINNATRFPKNRNCKIYFNTEIGDIKELRNVTGHSLVGLKVKDTVLDMEVVLQKEPEPWYKIHQLIYGKQECTYTDCIKLQFDLYKLYQYKLDLVSVANAIEKEFSDLHCIPSPLEKGRMDVFVDTRNITLPEETLAYVNSENAEQIYLEECVIPTLEQLYVCGIPGITNAYFVKEDNEWIVETDCIAGKNKLNSEEKKFFRKLLAHPSVDSTRTLCNDMWEIYDTLGIEATREFLLDEINTIMEGINECHVKLLVNRLTYTGTITGISRYTLRKEESGPMGKASFEETMDNFLTAGAHGDVENTGGVSASIVCGKRAKVGTGMMDLMMDMSELPPIIEEEDPLVEDEVVEIGYDSD